MYEENAEWILGFNSPSENEYLKVTLDDIEPLTCLNDLVPCRTIRMRSDCLNMHLKDGLKVIPLVHGSSRVDLVGGAPRVLPCLYHHLFCIASYPASLVATFVVAIYQPLELFGPLFGPPSLLVDFDFACRVRDAYCCCNWQPDQQVRCLRASC